MSNVSNISNLILLASHPFFTRRARIPEELAVDVLMAADLLNLPRLVQLTELSLQNVRVGEYELSFTHGTGD